jgi:uncharacterized heparinase superfamily protein
MNLPRLYHTLRHCKTEQLVAQVRHRLPGRTRGAVANAVDSAPSFPGCALAAACSPPPPLTGNNTASSLREGRFSFVNREASIGWPPDWQATDQPMLWRYNLQYFDWIWPLGLDDAKRVFSNWIKQHPIASGGVGWDPYPVSLRLINAGLFFFQRHSEAVLADESFRDTLWQSLSEHVSWLRRNLEIRLMGNHLLENLVALEIFARLFDGQENPTRDRLKQELREQLLSDGMHFERSPMYHLRALFLCELLAGVGSEITHQTLVNAREAAAMLTHPDGEIALFNDAAFNIYPSVGPAESQGAWSLPDAGYFGWRDRKGNYLICDAGPIGPDYIPGHAHADLLSFEWSISGKRFIVDSGVYDYVPGEMRDYCRSTAAHNTVEVNGADQVECWGAFRVARRGYPTVHEWETSDIGFTLNASHNGYARLARGMEHMRAFVFDAPRDLTITDVITGPGDTAIRIRFHLHPDWEIASIEGNTAALRSGDQSVQVCIEGDGSLDREASWYCPEFYTRVKNHCLVFSATGPGEWISRFKGAI